MFNSLNSIAMIIVCLPFVMAAFSTLPELMDILSDFIELKIEQRKNKTNKAVEH